MWRGLRHLIEAPGQITSALFNCAYGATRHNQCDCNRALRPANSLIVRYGFALIVSDTKSALIEGIMEEV
jgi:hypothetical protein